MVNRSNPSVSNAQTGQTLSGRVAAIFRDRSAAQSALKELKKAGFSNDDIGIATLADDSSSTGVSGQAPSRSGSTNRTADSKDDKSFWEEIKGFFGGGAESDDARTDYNDFRGHLSGIGVTDRDSDYYYSHLRSGGVLVTVRATGNREGEARRILQRMGGEFQSGADYKPSMRTDVGSEANQRLELRGEMLRVHKERISRGEVRLRKEVVTENQTFEVPVSREELVIERRPVESGREAASGSIGEGQDIRVPLSEEQVRIEKKPVVKEEVRVGKKAVQDSQTVSEDVRHEEIRVEGEGDVDVTGDTATPKRKKPAA